MSNGNPVIFSPYTDVCCSCGGSVLQRLVQYREAQKIGTLSVRIITPSNVDQFSNCFHCQNQEKICNNTITNISHHTSNVSLHYLVKCRCLITTTENKTSVTTHFEELTTGNNVLLSQLLSKVTVSSCSFYIKYSMCPPCCWTTNS